jgi:hypothetical protein
MTKLKLWSNILMETTELRCYVFVNLALSTIQKGVQGNHASVEVGVINDYNSMYRDWAKNHKTLIYLQGGFHTELQDQYKEFKRLCNKLDLPHAGFYEDEETMNCMFTSFAGVIPSTVYDMDLPIVQDDGKVMDQTVSDHRVGDMGTGHTVSGHTSYVNIRNLYPDEELALFLKQFRLAL